MEKNQEKNNNQNENEKEKEKEQFTPKKRLSPIIIDNPQNTVPSNNLNNKITLNSKEDLYILPMSKVLNEKLTNFSGKYFEELYEEALKLENNQNQDKDKEKEKEKEKDKTVPLENKNPKEPVKKSSETKTKLKTKQNSKPRPKSRSKSKSKSKDKKKIVIEKLKISIKKIIFNIKHATEMGKEVAVIGSINELGNWEQKKALKMNWNENNIWKVNLEIDCDNNIKNFEYKYIIINNGKYVSEWEDGENRKLEFSEIKGIIEKSYQCIKKSGNNNINIIHVDNYYNQVLDYNCKEFCLTINCEWNKK